MATDFESRLKTVLKNTGLSPDEILQITSAKAMAKYWLKSFTHQSSNIRYNYEMLEFLGDKIAGTCFTQYVSNNYPAITRQSELNSLNAVWMSKKHQPGLLRKMGLSEYIKSRVRVTESIEEDVFEAFIAALFMSVDEYLTSGLGYGSCYNLFSYLFRDINILSEETGEAPISLLGNYYNARWGHEIGQQFQNYVNLPIKRSGSGFDATYVDSEGNRLITEYGKDEATARLNAARAAIEMYEKEEGVSIDQARRRWRDRESEVSAIDESIPESERRAHQEFVELKPRLEELLASDRYKKLYTGYTFDKSKSDEEGTHSIELNFVKSNGDKTPKALGVGETQVEARLDAMKKYLNRLRR